MVSVANRSGMVASRRLRVAGGRLSKSCKWHCHGGVKVVSGSISRVFTLSRSVCTVKHTTGTTSTPTNGHHTSLILLCHRQHISVISLPNGYHIYLISSLFDFTVQPHLVSIPRNSEVYFRFFFLINQDPRCWITKNIYQ